MYMNISNSTLNYVTTCSSVLSNNTINWRQRKTWLM